MVKEALTITIDPESELARLLAVADDRPVVLNSQGIHYTVRREDIFAGYDPQRVLAGLRASRGALKGVDTKKLLADLAEQREQDSSRESS